MENSGLYFVGRCGSPNCAYYKRPTTLYIGKGRTFDFVKERRQCMCGHCFAAMTDVVHVLFFNCRWGYSGQLLTGGFSKSESEQRTTSYEFFPADKQEMLWKWLKFTVYDEAAPQRASTQSTQTLAEALRTSVAVQTDPELSSHSEEKVIDESVVDMLMSSEKRYREKYRALKRTYGVKKPKYV